MCFVQTHLVIVGTHTHSRNTRAHTEHWDSFMTRSVGGVTWHWYTADTRVGYLPLYPSSTKDTMELNIWNCDYFWIESYILQRNIWNHDCSYIESLYLTEKYRKIWLLLYWVFVSNTTFILSLFIYQRRIKKYDSSRN